MSWTWKADAFACQRASHCDLNLYNRTDTTQVTRADRSAYKDLSTIHLNEQITRPCTAHNLHDS